MSETRGPLVVSVTAVGRAPKRPIRRHRGQVGDRLLVTGSLGGAGAGLMVLDGAHGRSLVPQRVAARMVRRQLRPLPQVQAALALSRLNCVRSMADVSDGLHQDMQHVIAQGLGARINADALPLERGLADVCAAFKKSPVDVALLCGEDFELVMAVPQDAVAAAVKACKKVQVALTEIGEITANKGIVYTGHAAPSWRHGHGFSHFEAKS